MAIDSNGNVWDWGHDQFGELGNGKRRSSPNVAVQAIGPTHVVSIGEGDDFAAAVDASGDLWVWGWNSDGQLCLKGVRSVNIPVEMSGFGAAAVAGGGGHLLILMANGTVEACGLNHQGQLGNGSFHSSTRPVTVETKANTPLTNITAISAGNMLSEATAADGTVWTWGHNQLGQLGLGSTQNQDFAHEVNLPASATQVYAGGDYPNDGHMLAILSTGQVMAWGSNTWGQLGDGKTGGKSTVPVAVDVPSGVTFSYVVAGGADSFAIDSTGNLWAWGGRVGAGDLGDGTKGGGFVVPKQIGTGFTLASATANETVGYSTGP